METLPIVILCDIKVRMERQSAPEHKLGMFHSRGIAAEQRSQGVQQDHAAVSQSRVSDGKCDPLWSRRESRRGGR